MASSISSQTRFAAVIGNPAGHSLSPAMHNAGFAEAGIDAVYVAHSVAPEALAEAVSGMRALGYLGASITVPHKRSVMSLCTELTTAAQEIGAVNCLEFAEGSLIGHNTDAGGFVDSLGDAGLGSLTGKRVTVLGGGGAARAVLYGLKEAGATAKVVVRNPSKTTWTPCLSWEKDQLTALFPDTDILVDCTSIGLSAESEVHLPCELPLAALPEKAWVASLIYHRETFLLRDAAAAGRRVVNGAGMLLHQGARAFEIWTKRPAPVAVMRDALMTAICVADA